MNTVTGGGEALAGQRNLPADVTKRMARDLNHLPYGDNPGMCTLMGGERINYLVRFDYADGQRVWLTTAKEVNRCVVTRNGEFSTPAYVGEAVAAAYTRGRGPLRSTRTPA